MRTKDLLSRASAQKQQVLRFAHNDKYCCAAGKSDNCSIIGLLPAPVQANRQLPIANREFRLHSNYRHQLFHCRGAAIESGLLFGLQFDLDDFLDPLRAQLTRHPDKQPFDAVFAF